MPGLSLPGCRLAALHRIGHSRTSVGGCKGIAHMNPTLSHNRVEHLLGGFAGKRILVVGDVMLDEFIWGSVRRISPEAPVPVVEVRGESYVLGGAGNVAANIQALDGISVLIGILGK